MVHALAHNKNYKLLLGDILLVLWANKAYKDSIGYI